MRKHLLVLLLLITVVASGCTNEKQASPTSKDNMSEPKYVLDNRTYNFTHYQVEIRSDYNSLGGIEPYIHASDKREITLTTGKIDRIISTCNELFQNARTENGNICGDLRENLR